MSAAAGAPAAPVVPTAITVPPAFKKLVIIVAGMFYANQCPPAWWVDAADPKKDAPDPEHAMFQQEKKAAQINREAKRKAQQDTTGLGVILLTHLTEEQWVEEDDMARRLNLPNKMVRKALRYLEQEQLLRREHRKETKTHRKQEREMQIKAGLRPAPGSTAAAATAAGGDPAAAAAGAEEEDTIVARGLIVSYCALDYPRIVDSVRWRLATLRKNLQLELKSNNAIQKYKCPQAQCGKLYTSMDVWQMLPRDNAGTGKKELCCAICGTEVVMILDEGGKELGTMEDKKERKKKARHLLDTMDNALAPLQAQLDAVVNINAPDLLSYAGWMANQAALKQRMEVMEKEKAQNTAGSKRKVEAVYDLNTQVVVSFADTNANGSNAAAGAGHTAGGAPAAAAGGGGQAAVGRPSAHAPQPAAAPAASKVPPWLAKNAQQQQQQKATSKAMPPWLVSKAAAAAAGGMSTSQQQQQPGFGLDSSVKSEGGAFGFKADPAGVKVEGIKPEPGFKPDSELKQEPDFDDDEWQDVPGPGASDGDAAAAAAGSSQGVSLAAAAAAPEDDDMEEWEDV